MNIADIQAAVGPSTVRRSGNTWTVNCLMCMTQGPQHRRNDTSGRGGFTFVNGKVIYGCYNCKYGAIYDEGKHITKKFGDLVKNYGLVVDGAGGGSRRHRHGALPLLSPKEIQEENDKKALEYISRWHIPKYAKPLGRYARLLDKDSPRHLLDYLENRGFSLGDYLFYYHTQYKPAIPSLQNPNPNDWDMTNRITLPYIWDDKIVAIVARHTGGHPKKYFRNNEGMLIFNIMAMFDTDVKNIIICEGVFDALAVTSLEHKTAGVSTVTVPSDNVLNILKYLAKRCDKQLILCPDNDLAGWPAIDKGISFDIPIAFPDYFNANIKDPAEFLMASNKVTKKMICENILDTTVYDTDTIYEKKLIHLPWK